MLSINGLLRQTLNDEGFVGTVNDALRKKLVSLVSPTQELGIDNLFARYLIDQGYSGSFPGMLYRYLGDKGYTGSLPKRFHDALVDGALFASTDDPSILFEGGEYGDFWDFTDASTLKQDDTGLVDVVAVNDPIGLAQGKRGVIDLKQATTGRKFNWSGSSADNTVNAWSQITSPVNNKLYGKGTLFICYQVYEPSNNITSYTAIALFDPADGEGAFLPSSVIRVRNNYGTAITERSIATKWRDGATGTLQPGGLMTSDTYHTVAFRTTPASDTDIFFDNVEYANSPTSGAGPDWDRVSLFSYTTSAFNRSAIKFALFIDRSLTDEEITFLHDYAMGL